MIFSRGHRELEGHSDALYDLSWPRREGCSGEGEKGSSPGAERRSGYYMQQRHHRGWPSQQERICIMKAAVSIHPLSEWRICLRRNSSFCLNSFHVQHQKFLSFLSDSLGSFSGCTSDPAKASCQQKNSISYRITE